MSEWLTAVEAAEKTGVAYCSIYKYIRDGSIPSKAITRKTRVGQTRHVKGVRAQDVVTCRNKIKAGKANQKAKTMQRNREIREEEWPHFRAILGPEMAIHRLAKSYGILPDSMRSIVGVDIAEVAA